MQVNLRSSMKILDITEGRRSGCGHRQYAVIMKEISGLIDSTGDMGIRRAIRAETLLQLSTHHHGVNARISWMNPLAMFGVTVKAGSAKRAKLVDPGPISLIGNSRFDRC